MCEQCGGYEDVEYVEEFTEADAAEYAVYSAGSATPAYTMTSTWPPADSSKVDWTLTTTSTQVSTVMLQNVTHLVAIGSSTTSCCGVKITSVASPAMFTANPEKQSCPYNPYKPKKPSVVYPSENYIPVAYQSSPRRFASGKNGVVLVEVTFL